MAVKQSDSSEQLNDNFLVNEFSRKRCDYHLINGYNVCVVATWLVQEEKERHKFEAGGSRNHVVTLMIEALMQRNHFRF